MEFLLLGPFYPVHTGSTAIRLNIAPNRRRFRCPSAKSRLAPPLCYCYRYLDGGQENEIRANLLFGRAFEKATRQGLRPCVTLAFLASMIVGIGIDIVEVLRIAAAVERFGERPLNRVFTVSEIRSCGSKQNATERFAARFAAKEAGFKALGTGWRHGVTWKDVEVGREPGRRPTLCYSGKAAEFAAKLRVRRASLSFPHTAEQAIAQVILED